MSEILKIGQSQFRTINIDDVFSFKVEPVLNDFLEVSGVIITIIHKNSTPTIIRIKDGKKYEDTLNEVRTVLNKDKNFYEFKLRSKVIKITTGIFRRKEHVIGKWEYSVDILTNDLGLLMHLVKITIKEDCKVDNKPVCFKTVYESYYGDPKEALDFITEIEQYEFDKF